jgi:Tol biopolymer transport system component
MKKTFRMNLLIGAAALSALALTGCSSGRNQTNLVAYLQSTAAPVTPGVAKALVHAPGSKAPQKGGAPAVATVNIPAGTFDAWIVDASAATPKPFKLSSTPGLYTGIQLSKNGTAVVFTAFDNNAANCDTLRGLGCSQVFVASVLDFGNPIQLTNSTTEDHFAARFSPDGTIVTSSVFDNDAFVSELSTIPITSTMPFTFGAETLIAPPATLAGLFYPSLTPDNRKIVFEGESVTEGTNAAIYIMNLDGTGLTQLTNPDNAFWDWHPSLSEDGKTLLFTRIDPASSNVNNIAVLNNHVESATNPAKVLTTDGFSWDSQGVRNFIIFNDFDPVAGNDNIFKMSPSGTGVVPLTTGTLDCIWDVFGNAYIFI